MNIRLKLEIQRFLVNYVVGFLIYMAIEIIFRTITGQKANGNAYINLLLMGNLGGIVLNILGNLDRIKKFSDIPFKIKCLIGGLIISLCEFLAGLVINVWLGLDGWDYMNNFLGPLFLGQTCFKFIILWILITPFVYWVDSSFDYLVRVYNVFVKNKQEEPGFEKYISYIFSYEISFKKLLKNYAKLLLMWGKEVWVK